MHDGRIYDGRAPVAPIDITTAGFARNPITGYNALRDACPVAWQPGARGFLLTRADDVARAFRDPLLREPDLSRGWRKIGAKLGLDFSAALDLFSYMPFIHEGERHKQLRTTLAKAIAPFAAANDVFERCVSRRMAPVKRDGGFDLVASFAGTLVFDVFCELMEVPEAARDEIRPIANLSWVLESTLSVKHRRRMNAVLARSMETLERHARKTLQQPGASLIHHIEQALPSAEGDKPRVAASLAAVMLVMGNDGLGGCISFAVANLLSGATPNALPQERWAELSDDAIRYSATIDFQNRILSTDMDLGGCPFRRGERLILSPLAANHDPALLGPDAGAVRPRPEVGPGLTFGAGAHVCVGARLSRNIARKAFEGLAGLPRLALLAPAAEGPGKVIRTLSSLPLQIN
jgi:cytochrome P450